MKNIILIILIVCLVLTGCNKKNNSDNNNTNNGNTDNKYSDSMFIPKLANKDENIKCDAGDYDSNFDGFRDFTIECENGKRSKITGYSIINHSVKEYISSITIFDDNQRLTKLTQFYSNGNKQFESLYRTDGSLQSSIYYYENGNKQQEHLYRTDEKQSHLKSYLNNGSLSITRYYDGNGDSCDPITEKCVESDDD